MAEIIMTAEELVRRHVRAAGCRTVYMYASYGFQVTAATVAMKARQNLNGWYTPARVAALKALADQDPPVWGFDCVNLTKGILWGWEADGTKLSGGAVYASRGVPDTNADGMIRLCGDVSGDFSSLRPGEGLWLPGHWGLYVGGGLAVECTNRAGWKSGVQLSAVWNVARREGYNGRTWEKHGRLPWISYPEGMETAPADPMKDTFTVTLRGVSRGEADALKRRWPDCVMLREAR